MKSGAEYNITLESERRIKFPGILKLFSHNGPANRPDSLNLFPIHHTKMMP